VLELAYKRAPFFEQLAPTVSAWYCGRFRAKDGFEACQSL
jgi:hypothetical protein